MERQFGAVLPGDYMNLINSVDPDCPPSKHPCVGCGAPIHCCYPHQPGFISSGKFHAMTNLQKQNSKCLRCQSLEHHNVLLHAKVTLLSNHKKSEETCKIHVIIFFFNHVTTIVVIVGRILLGYAVVCQVLNL